MSKWFIRASQKKKINEEVTPNGEPKQGDFNYSLDLESAEQDISVKNLKVSRNNE